MVIVSYNTRDLLRRCLNSLTESNIGEIIVVDNSSKDGSAEMVASDFPGVVLIQSGLNLGYGAANNRGSALAKHELVLFESRLRGE